MKEETLSNEVAEFIKNKRNALGLTQEALAELIYGDPKKKGYISEIESGKRKITVTTLGYFLTALNSWVKFTE